MLDLRHTTTLCQLLNFSQKNWALLQTIRLYFLLNLHFSMQKNPLVLSFLLQLMELSELHYCIKQQYDYFRYSNHLTSKNGQQNKFSKRNDLNKGKKGKKIENRVRNKCKASFSFLNLQFDRLKKKWLPYIKMDTSGHNGIN